MGLTASLLAVLLGSAAPVPADAVTPDEDSFGWCVAERVGKPADTRYFSDTFEGPIDDSVQGGFQEYVVRSYLRGAGITGYATTCSSYHGKAAADAALAKAQIANKPIRDVNTAWRTHFE